MFLGLLLVVPLEELPQEISLVIRLLENATEVSAVAHDCDLVEVIADNVGKEGVHPGCVIVAGMQVRHQLLGLYFIFFALAQLLLV